MTECLMSIDTYSWGWLLCHIEIKKYQYHFIRAIRIMLTVNIILTFANGCKCSYWTFNQNVDTNLLCTHNHIRRIRIESWCPIGKFWAVNGSDVVTHSIAVCQSSDCSDIFSPWVVNDDEKGEQRNFLLLMTQIITGIL